METTNVIIKPLVTEKSTHLQNTRNSYAFQVNAAANKHQIKNAVEKIYEVKVVDVRTIVPFDDETLEASVRRTGRCVVLQEAPGFAGVAAEIAARVQERCFHSLQAPVLRVTGLDIPYPPPKLEHYHLPGVDRILDAVDRLQWDDQPWVR